MIDKYTGKAALKNRLYEMGLTISDQELKTILKEIKSQPEKVSWGDDDLTSLAQSIQRKV